MQNAELNRIGTIRLRAKAKRRDYFNAVWEHKTNNRRYKIVKRVDCFVHVRWDGLGSSPPAGMSVKYTVGEFYKTFDLSNNQQ